MNIVFHVGYSKEPWDNDTPALGGTEQCVNKLGMEMALKGHNVFIVGEVNQVRPQKNIVYLPSSNMQLLPEDIDVLIGVSYLHFYKHYNCSKIKKILFWLHNEEPFYWFKGEKMSETEINKAYDLCDNIICLTDWHKQHVLTYNPRIEEKIKIIGNGISLKERKRGTYKVPGSYLYSSHPERGLDKLLNEWPSIKEKRPYATLAIATPAYGLEYYNEHFSEKVKSLKNRNVSFLGSLSTDALYNRMKTTETWYYPTDYKETYCVTALEMMAHGVIVDTNEIAGLKETVNGFNKSTDWERIEKYVQTRDWKNVSEDWYNLIETKMQTVVNDADMTYVVCLDVDEQKKKEITDRFESFGFNSPLTIWNACNGYTGEYMPDTYSVCKHWKLKDKPNHFWTRNVTDGEIGCAASHYTIWLDAQEKKYNRILILEEDFEVKRKFDPSEIETNHPWTLMYLGCIFQEPPSDFNDKLCKPNYTYQTHAYMLTGNGVRLLLEQQFQNYFFAVDEFLPATYCDHPRGDLGYITQDTIALAVREDFLTQSERSSTTEPRVFSLSDYSYKAFVRRFIHESAKTKQWDLICDENIPDVFSYPLFTEEFCSLAIEEANNLNQWTKERHDNYPTTDILLESIGLDKIYSQVLREFVYPCAIHKWKLEGGPWPNLSSENFMIKYDEDVQGHLALHHDAGLISCVLTLNKNFEGGGTWFWRQQKVHKGNIGEISIHPAKITHRHGGRPISKGERYIIVSFCSKP